MKQRIQNLIQRLKNEKSRASKPDAEYLATIINGFTEVVRVADLKHGR